MPGIHAPDRGTVAPDSSHALLALPATTLETRVAWVAMALSFGVFVALVPFARVPWPREILFIPIYSSALAVNDVVTAALLVGQFVVWRSSAIRWLLCGYLFTAALAIVHMLSFPGLFAEGGLLGGDSQTTAWLYMFWHGGFAVSVFAYSVDRRMAQGSIARALCVGLGLTLLAALLTVAFATGRLVALPAIMEGNHYTPAMRAVVAAVWLASAAALAAVWRKPDRSVLDLWMAVVMMAWLCDIGLAAVFNAGRFDAGFYLGRGYGLLAATLVLVNLLVQNGWMYAQLLAASDELRRLMSADPLTGIANRRTFDDALKQEWARAQRQHQSLALLMIDVDHFKAFNDRYGHVAGDACLCQVAACLQQSAHRVGDLAARLGGEEFAVLLPATSADAALIVAQHAREALAALNVPHDRSPSSDYVSISIGVAACEPAPGNLLRDESSSVSPVCLVRAADSALYAAKQGGRNRVSVFDRPIDMLDQQGAVVSPAA